MPTIQHSRVFPASRAQVFQFLFLEEAWERGIPPEFDSEQIEIGPPREKSILKWRLTRFGLSFDWAVSIDYFKKNESVIISQKIGLFEEWTLTQTLLEHSEKECKLIDTLEYKMPLGLLGVLSDDLFLRREWRRLLESRHKKIDELLESFL